MTPEEAYRFAGLIMLWLDQNTDVGDWDPSVVKESKEAIAEILEDKNPGGQE